MEHGTAYTAIGGASLNRLAVSATTHCLTGCAIGEFAGMAIATALRWGNLAQTVLAIVLAYFFGFALTAMPLIRAGLAAGAIVSTALAAFAFLANRYMIARGRGHAVVHEYHGHQV